MSIFQKIKYGCCLLGILFGLANTELYAQYQEENIAAGSYIISMGETPQSFDNALKPYGLLYSLLKSNPLEVKWVINSEKAKDGIDFRYDEKEYRSGAFIIPVSYINKSVRSQIKIWTKKGVVGRFTRHKLTVPVFSNLSVAPRWTLDRQNGFLALPFFKAAGIPETAYGGDDSSFWKEPQELGVCDDIFVMPHAEPKFETHKNLYFWNKNYKGAIWAGCHAASQLENLHGSVSKEKNAEIIQLNFLSAGFAGARTTGLVPYYEHRYATPPYEHLLPADPVAQYLGSNDGAHLNGSERIFYPKKANAWRKQTKPIVVDPSPPDVPHLSNGPGAVIIYGPGFGNTKNGLVMYQASHSIYGKDAQNIAAMRVFFNWSFLAAERKRKENFLLFESGVEVPKIKTRIGDNLIDILNLNPILFDLDKFEIKEESAEQLDKIVKVLLEYPELLIDIRSHTDSRANSNYNYNLSRKRVTATTNYLIEKGVNRSRISGRGYGETQLINDCGNAKPCSEKEHKMNRRSEFILSIDCDLYSGRSKMK